MGKPSIALLHYSCPPVIGGVEFIVEAHARLFAEAGYPTRLVVGKGGRVHPRVRTIVLPEISSKGGELSAILRSLRRGHVPEGFADAVSRVQRRLSKALRGVDVCIVHNALTMHFNLVLTAALARTMERTRTKRFIGWVHDLTFSDPHYAAHQKEKYPWSLLKQALSGCRYCAISAQEQKEVVDLFGVRSCDIPVISDGIDVSEFLGLTPLVSEIFHSQRLYRKDIVLLTPTRIVPRKRLEVGIEIVAALKKMGKSVLWMITGAPDPYNKDAMAYFRQLAALRRKLKVRREIMFLGEHNKDRVSDEDRRSLYAVSHGLLFPSEREGFGIPVVEAGIAGLLIIASDIPSLRELVEPDAVLIRGDDTPEHVAARIVRATDKSWQLSFKAKCIREYCWDAVFSNRIVPAIMRPKTVWKDEEA